MNNDGLSDENPDPSQGKQLAAQIVGVRRETETAKIGFGQLMPLDHRAHRAVEDEDASRDQFV